MLASNSIFRHIVAAASLLGCSLAASAQPLSASLSNSAYLTTANTAALSPAQFTIEARIRPDGIGYGLSNDADGSVIIAKPRQGSSGSYLWSWTLNWSPVTGKINAGVCHSFSSSATVIVSNRSIGFGQAAHLAATFDGTTLRLYIDGVLDSSAVAPTSVVYYGANEPVLIGAGNYAVGYLRRFQGLIDDVRIWDRARSASEIAAGAACDFAGPRTGLLAEYSFDNNLTPDVSGHGRDASFVGTAGTGPNICGLSTARSALVRDSNFLTATNSATRNPQQLTLEAWVRPDGPGYGNSTTGAIVLAKPRQGESGAGALTSWELGWSPSTNRVYFLVGHALHGSYDIVSSTTSVLPGQSVHIAATFDGVFLRLYINGVLDASLAATSPTIFYSTTDPILIGAGNYGAGYLRRFQGLIDDVRIWDRARTASEISSSASCQLADGQPGLLANWVFDGFSTADVSGNDRNATFVNLPTYGPNLGGGASASITSQPAASDICPSATATFSVDATGSGPLIYHWQWQPAGASTAWINLSSGSNADIGGTPVLSAANANTSTLAAQPLAAYTNFAPRAFRCAVTSACGNTASTEAILTVIPCVGCSLADIAGGGPDGRSFDGIVDGSDFTAFINSFGAGDPGIDPLADVAGGGPDGLSPDGIIDGSDFIAFINAFAAGC